MSNGWIGVDLDGTLAEYHGWENTFQIGKPVPAMADRVRHWLKEGRDVRIFTARVDGGYIAAQLNPELENSIIEVYRQVDLIVKLIQDWTEKHFGKRLPVTCRKDYGMIELWDDRCVQVETNTGRILSYVPPEWI